MRPPDSLKTASDSHQRWVPVEERGGGDKSAGGSLKSEDGKMEPVKEERRGGGDVKVRSEEGRGGGDVKVRSEEGRGGGDMTTKSGGEVVMSEEGRGGKVKSEEGRGGKVKTEAATEENGASSTTPTAVDFSL